MHADESEYAVISCYIIAHQLRNTYKVRLLSTEFHYLVNMIVIFFIYGCEFFVMTPDKCTSPAAEAAENELHVTVMTDEDRTTFLRDSTSFSSEKLIICEITV